MKKSISLYDLENQIEEGNYRKNMNKIMLVESLQLLSAQVSANLTYPISGDKFYNTLIESCKLEVLIVFILLKTSGLRITKKLKIYRNKPKHQAY